MSSLFEQAIINALNSINPQKVLEGKVANAIIRAGFDDQENSEETQEIIKGKIDVLVLQDKLWLLIIESKRSNFSLAKAIPQALIYMLANPQPEQPVYSLVMNGEDFQFMKLIKRDKLIYGLSDRFTLYRCENELYKVINILKKLGQVLI